jgi:RND family efflux transporter MFP subunit
MESTQTATPLAVAPAPAGHNGRPHDHDQIDLNVPKPRAGWVIAVAVIAMLALGGLLLVGLIPRQQAGKELKADAAEAANAPVMVTVVHPHRAQPSVNVSLPGTLRPWQEVSIFARTTGYLKKYYVDISNEVKANDIMAEIDTPELNEELAQAKAAADLARAAVTRATADRDLAKSTLERNIALKETQSVSPQTLDEKQSAVNVAESNIASAKANVAAAEASVRRLTELQGFEKITAPFSGVVTGRSYDVGSLILANPTATDAKPLFKIAENDVLRAFVNIPQSFALEVKKGMKVNVTVRERPGRTFPGFVMGTTNYLDPTNRSLLTEVKVPNPKEADGSFALLPGMYVEASFTVTRDTPPLVVPGPSIINNAQGTQVAVMRDGQAHFQKVVIGKDFGNEVEIAQGLTAQDEVISNPGERVVEGVAVSTGDEKGDETPVNNPPPRVKVSEATK